LQVVWHIWVSILRIIFYKNIIKYYINNLLIYTYIFFLKKKKTAPEVLGKKGYFSAVDWWSLGVMMYELLYGKVKFIIT